MKTLFVLPALAAVSMVVTAQTRYVVTDLGSLGGANAFAQAINNAGQVAGLANLASGDTRGFRTGPNSPINPATDVIPTLGGNFSAATGINSSGQVSGNANDTATPFPHTHAIRFDANGTLHDLGFLGFPSSDGNAINDSGQVTGAAVVNFSACSFIGSEPGFRTQPNSAINPATDSLGTLFTGLQSGCRYSDGFGINNAGQVVGNSAAVSIFNPEVHAMLATPGSPMTDLGVLGGTATFPAASGKNAQANAINSSGQIVGESTYNGAPFYYANHPFLTTAAGPMQDLGTLGGSFGSANGINTSGQIVGSATLTGDTANHAFLDVGGVMSDLNTMIAPGSGWELVDAHAINDNGQIAATGWLNGVKFVGHAVRLDPANVAVSILETQVVNLGLPHGTQSSLLSKLLDANAAIQISDFSTAIGDLGALIHEVNAQTGKKISASSAAALIAAANAIIAAI